MKTSNMETLESPEPVQLKPKYSVDNPISDHINPCFYQVAEDQPELNIRHIKLIKKRAKEDINILESRLKRLYEEDLKVSRQIEKIKADRSRLQAQRFYRYKEDQYKLDKQLQGKEASETLKQKNMHDKILTTERIKTSRSDSTLRKSESIMQMKMDYLYNKRYMESQRLASKQFPTTHSPYTFNFSVPLIYQRNKEESSKVLQQNQQVEQLLDKVKMYKGIENNLNKKLNITSEEIQKELDRFKDLSLYSRHIRSSSQAMRPINMPKVFKKS